VDENEQVFYPDSANEDGKRTKDSMSPSKRAQEVLPAEISKLSINDKSKAD